MLGEMANIAGECLKKPRTASVWSSELGRYVCVDSRQAQEELSQPAPESQVRHQPINPTFKLVFLTSFVGTLVFAAACVGMSLMAGREPPPLFEKVILAMFDLVKIGFGAIVGLLGGKRIQDVGAAKAKDPLS